MLHPELSRSRHLTYIGSLHGMTNRHCDDTSVPEFAGCLKLPADRLVSHIKPTVHMLCVHALYMQMYIATVDYIVCSYDNSV